MIAFEDLLPNSTFEDNCGHLFVLRTFSIQVTIGQDGMRRPRGTATLDRLTPNSNERPLSITIPIDGVPLLKKVADYDLSATAATLKEALVSAAA